MRIETLRLKNLNSLAGEWSLDLTHPAYLTDGLFAITGPTGAGKSTILDAICLALYGRTPRLSSINKGGNDILSRHSGECFAEVSFSTQKGRYRCRWSQRRARKKPDGELQSPQQELVNADSGEIVASQIRGVAQQIEEITGMDFERFTRSMLLAQGGFAAFLQAAPDQRAPILEQITGTAIYSQISIKVHERYRAEQGQLALLKAETQGIQLLQAEQETAIQQALHQQEQQLEQQAADLKQIQAGLHGWQRLEQLQHELGRLQEQASQLDQQRQAFAPERQRLALARQAASLDGDYASLQALRKQQAADQAQLQRQQARLPEQEQALHAQAEALQQAEVELQRARQQRQNAAPLIKQVRALDQTLQQQAKAIAQQEQACQAEQAKVAQQDQALALEQAEQQRQQQALAQLHDYLAAHRQDEWLLTQLTGLEAQLADLQAKAAELERKQSERDAAQQAQQQAQVKETAQQQRCAQAARALAQAEARLGQVQQQLSQLLQGKHLREYRAEKDNRLQEQIYLTRIAKLEQERAQLHAGQPCPLCGSREHPFAQAAQLPRPDENQRQIAQLNQLIDQAEALEGRIRQDEAELSRQQQQHNAAQLALSQCSHERHSSETRLAEREQALAQLRAAQTQRHAELSAQAQAQGLPPLAAQEPAAWLQGLKQRLHQWQAKTQAKADAERQLNASAAEMQRLQAIKETHQASLEGQRQQLLHLRQEQAAIQTRRQQGYGTKNPDQEEQRLEQEVHKAEIGERQARAGHSSAEQQLQAARGQIQTLSTAMAERRAQLEPAEQALSQALSRAGFADEAQFQAARMTPAQRSALEDRAKGLDDAHTALQAQISQAQAQQAAEQAQQINQPPKPVLHAKALEREQTIQALNEHIAQAKHQLQQNQQAQQRLASKQQAIAAQQEECARWEPLHQLIGSADGKKYRNFAQGLTFDLMVGQANRQLQKMTDRYLLIRDGQQPLELNVIDNYQAGEIRCTKNLSGGESFIVSLALALGLSHMASRNVRVDSLFLDEGFGSLDEDALSTALETLAGLNQEGKLIGVISHVGALKERIGTRIQVKPINGGHSILQGPGCEGH
jgi:exonuclease SbcC